MHGSVRNDDDAHLFGGISQQLMRDLGCIGLRRCTQGLPQSLDNGQPLQGRGMHGLAKTKARAPFSRKRTSTSSDRTCFCRCAFNGPGRERRDEVSFFCQQSTGKPPRHSGAWDVHPSECQGHHRKEKPCRPCSAMKRSITRTEADRAFLPAGRIRCRPPPVHRPKRIVRSIMPLPVNDARA